MGFLARKFLPIPETRVEIQAWLSGYPVVPEGKMKSGQGNLKKHANPVGQCDVVLFFVDKVVPGSYCPQLNGYSILCWEYAMKAALRRQDGEQLSALDMVAGAEDKG